MDKYYWYLGNGKYLEGEKALEHVRILNERSIKLRKYILDQIDEIIEYLNEYEINENDDFSSLFENVMELSERCSVTSLLLAHLSEHIEERNSND